MKENKTKYVILGLLTEGDLTGYDIKKIIDVRFHFFWNESYGQLYPELKKLVGQGWITEKKAVGSSKREKISYAITEKGLTALREWLVRPAEKESVRFEILLKMYFSSLADDDAISVQIAEFRSRYEEQLMILGLFEKELKNISSQHGNHPDILRVIDFGQRVYRAYVEWSDETLNYLKGRDKK